MRLSMMLLCCSLLAGVVGAEERKSSNPLVVHEWGTFTVLQDDQGHPIDGVNINEESLPDFVHELAPHLAPDSHALRALFDIGSQQVRRSKGIARSYPAARMRMETPIIYLYPPDDAKKAVDVSVQFRGGWVTEWYPQAKVNAPGYRRVLTSNLHVELTSDTAGSIQWQGVQLNADLTPPKTDSPVWLAPRATSAPTLVAKNGESEHYLFYRGVANLEAPIRVSRVGEDLQIRRNPNSTCPIKDFSPVKMWLVDVRGPDDLRFRSVDIDMQTLSKSGLLANTLANTDVQCKKGLPSLRKEMLTALIETGLFEDEAIAMLNTWEASYFKATGLRLFFTLPQAWTDRVLPLKVSGYEKQETVRTMIGRIEMVSPRQRALLEAIGKGPVSNRTWYTEWVRKNEKSWATVSRELLSDKASMKELGLDPPADYRAYMELGRFRDALLKHGMASSKLRNNLRRFAASYGLR